MHDRQKPGGKNNHSAHYLVLSLDSREQLLPRQPYLPHGCACPPHRLQRCVENKKLAVAHFTGNNTPLAGILDRSPVGTIPDGKNPRQKQQARRLTGYKLFKVIPRVMTAFYV